jgi:hypothetical protein
LELGQHDTRNASVMASASSLRVPQIAQVVDQCPRHGVRYCAEPGIPVRILSLEPALT